MKFLERDHPVIPPVPSPIKMLIFLLWNRIWSSRSVKVTNIPPVFLCSSLHFYQGIQIDVWWIILRGPKPTPSLCLTDLAFLIQRRLWVSCSHWLWLVILSSSSPSHAVFRMHLTFCGVPKPPLLSDGFLNSLISSDERPLDTYRFYIHCTWRLSPLCSCPFPTGSPCKHCFVLIDLSFLTICYWINFHVSCFYFSILPVFCSWPTYLNCTRVFLRNLSVLKADVT